MDQPLAAPPPTRFGRSIRARLLLMMLAVVATAALSGYSGFAYWQLAAQKERLLGFAHSLAEVLGQEFVRIALLNDPAVGADASARLSAFPLVRHVVLYDRNGTAVYQYRRHALAAIEVPLAQPGAGPRDDGDALHLFLPAAYSGVDFGTIYVQLESETLWTLLRRDLVVLGLIGILSLSLALLLAARFEAHFNRPIRRLVGFLERIGLSQQLDQRIAVDGSDEFARLFHEVNTMLDRIQSSRDALRVAAVAFETPDGMLIADAAQHILQVNQAFTRITGYSAAEVVGKTPALLQSGRHGREFFEAMWRALREVGRWEGEIWNRRKNGEVYPERLTIQAVHDESGVLKYYVGAFVDISVQKAAEAHIEYLGHYDPLTGLANRRLLVDRLGASLQRTRQSRGHGAVLCFDVDNFKMVNDSLGHAAGDQLLVEVARRLREVLGSGSLIARLGADEFIAVREMRDGDRNQATLQVKELVESVLDELDRPYQINGSEVRCASCAGVSMYPGAGVSAEDLVKQADLALHQAKSAAGRRRVRFFEPQAQEVVRRYLNLHADLLRALERGEFVLHYQPQVDGSGRVRGAEALIRWQHPEEGLVGPAEFIPVAERSGLIIGVGEWVLDSACRQLAQWAALPTSCDWVVALNVSARQFAQADFVDQVRNALLRSGAPARQLKLELTEGLLVDDIDDAVLRMNALRQMGVGLALDDFGTGYSSLRYLKRLPLSQVKIDQSFVRDMLNNGNDVAIIRSILSLGESFGLEVIAEGVETADQHAFLQELGCAAFQGYLFGRPQPAAALSAASC